MHSKWDNFELPQLTENNYGIKWPPNTAQITKELLCFKSHRMGTHTRGMQSALVHFLNIQRMLFPTMVQLYVDVPKGRIWNNYYLDIAEQLTDFNGTGQDRNLFTGPASANKTYCVASYVFASFLMAPSETLAMVSTTSGSASERRIWADIKDFHREGKYDDCGIARIGEIIEYQKAIVFDEGKELGAADKNSRDFRNGISVIPIAADQTGDTALSTIQGSKNRFVIWALDEMAQMNQGVTRPCGNLGQNPHFQFIGIANAGDPTDPHGLDCSPPGGIETLNVDVDRRWESSTGKKVLFLHGDDTPNNHPFVDQSKMKKVTDFPFPYASDRLSANIAAKQYGNGSIEKGKETIDYYKFCIGFWPSASASSSLYTKNLITSFNADKDHDILVGGIRAFGAGDFGFSYGGDSNSFFGANFGFNNKGQKRINFDSSATTIRCNVKSKDEFIKQTALGFVREIQKRKINYRDFGGDTGNDASLMMNEMSRAASTYDFVGISSIGNPVNTKKYKNKVTELWFQARDLIRTGMCRGISTTADYYLQLTQRRYTSFGKGCNEIEQKAKCKKRIGRSPDDADAFIYLCYMIIRSGLVDEELAQVRAVKYDAEDGLDSDYVETEAGVFVPKQNPFAASMRKEEEFQLTEYDEPIDEYASLF